MRFLLFGSGLVLALTFASSAWAVSIDWTVVGNPGNAGDPQPCATCPATFGSVPYSYRIGTYEVTNAQYVEFLNAKAASDPLALYSANMSAGVGGITRSGTTGLYTYSAIAGRENLPVNWVSFYDALRFANWMSNGQGAGDTETGAYTLLGGAATPSNGGTVTRNAGATIVLPSEDEWYKAAYYDSSSASYFDYPVGSNAQISCATPGATPNTANCANAVGDLTGGGSYAGAASPYGTFDQGGNLREWNEASIHSGNFRGILGGSMFDNALALAASSRSSDSPTEECNCLGIRVAMIPEPSTGVLVMSGLLGLAGWRSTRALRS